MREPETVMQPEDMVQGTNPEGVIYGRGDLPSTFEECFAQAAAARGPQTFDGPLLFNLSHWTDGDLYRGIQTEPHTHDFAGVLVEACDGCRWIERYVLELAARRKAREQEAEAAREIDRRFGI